MADGRWKLPSENLLATSKSRGWRGLAVERRRHSVEELPEMASDTTVVAIALEGNPHAIIQRRGNGVRQEARAVTGAIWLCPKGVAEDSIRITDAIPEMLHLYLGARPFVALSQEDHYPELDAGCVSYVSGARDPVIAALATAVADELATETSAGRLLVEAAALLLAARLVHKHGTEALPAAAGARQVRPLDPARLRRVVEFVDTNLGDEMSVDDLAAVACLSPFHFARAFKAATGMPPHRFVAARRLERAKALLAHGDVPLADVALMSSFSSQASFTKAFCRAVGMSPGAWRRRPR